MSLLTATRLILCLLALWALPLHAQTGTVAGQITDARSGLPLADARVEIGSSGPFMDFTVIQTAFTGADGFYSFEVPGSRSYLVRVFPPLPYLPTIWPFKACRYGFCTTTSLGNIFVDPDQVTVIDVAVTTPGSFSGSVLRDADGQPLSGATVAARWINQPGQLSSFVNVEAVSAADGRYSIDGLPPGQYRVRIDAGSDYVDELFDDIVCLSRCNSGGIGETPVVVTADNDRGAVDFGMAEAAQISGIVTDASGNPPQLANLVVEVVAYRVDSGNLEVVRTDFLFPELGSYSLQGLPAGEYRIATDGCAFGDCPTYVNQVHAERTCQGPFCTLEEISAGDAVVLAPGESASADFALDPAASINGCVRDTNDNGIAGVLVEAYMWRDGPFGGITRINNSMTDARGCYRIDHMPSDSVASRPIRLRTANAAGFIDQIYSRINCWGGNCPIDLGAPVALAHDQDLHDMDFTLLDGVFIGGRVLLSENGPPADGVSLILVDSQNQWVRNFDANLLITAGDGRFQTFGLVNDTYFLAAEYAGERFVLGLAGPQPAGTPAQSGQPIIVDGSSVADIVWVLNPDGILRNGFE